MIEIHTIYDNVDLKDGRVLDTSYHQLVVDGKVLADEQADVMVGRRILGVYTYDVTISEEGLACLSTRRPSDFPDLVNRILIKQNNLEFEDGSIRLLVEAVKEGIAFGFRVFFNGTRWKHPWSIREYNTEFRQAATALGPAVLSRWSDKYVVPNGLFYHFNCPDTDMELGSAASQFLPIVEGLHHTTVTALASKVWNDALIASFQFPKEVSVPCEQYLLYFVQFLRDIGVEATANIQHDAGSLLFSVTPDSKDVALENIREALTVYLQLPSNPNIGLEVVPVGDIQTQQLIANVQHLQGQLRLASAALQLQDTATQQKNQTIQDQRFVIDYQQKLLDGNVVSASLQGTSIERGNEDREEILDGAVAFTKAEKYGVEVSTAKIFRCVKALFVGKKTQAPLLEAPREKEI